MMVKIIIGTLLVFVSNAFAIPGYFGDVKVISYSEKSFVVEQAGYRLEVLTQKLPKDIVSLWKKNVGKVIESAVPYIAVERETKIANYISSAPSNR